MRLSGPGEREAVGALANRHVHRYTLAASLLLEGICGARF